MPAIYVFCIQNDHYITTFHYPYIIIHHLKALLDLRVLNSLAHMVDNMVDNNKRTQCVLLLLLFLLYNSYSFIKLQIKLKSFYILLCGDTTVADREVQFLMVLPSKSSKKMCLY